MARAKQNSETYRQIFIARICDKLIQRTACVLNIQRPDSVALFIHTVKKPQLGVCCLPLVLHLILTISSLF